MTESKTFASPRILLQRDTETFMRTKVLYFPGLSVVKHLATCACGIFQFSENTSPNRLQTIRLRYLAEKPHWIKRRVWEKKCAGEDQFCAESRIRASCCSPFARKDMSKTLDVSKISRVMRSTLSLFDSVGGD